MLGILFLGIAFIAFLFSIPFLMEGSMRASLPFKASEAYDIWYDPHTEILYFKTGELMDPVEWSFNGFCTVWYWRSGKRCSTLVENELYEIWDKFFWNKEE